MSESWVCLIKVKSGAGLRSHVIDKPSFTIGRTQEADVPIVDSSVSRVHLSVQVKPEGIWISDKKSANGTLLNGKAIFPGQSFPVLPGDIVKLGSSNDEFSFQVIPKPFELSSLDEQRNVLMASMDKLAKELDARAERRIEEELKQMRQEVEQARSQSKLELDTMKAQAAAEIQEKKAALEAELAKVRKSAQSVGDEERKRARLEADSLVSQAQIRIKKDFEESSQRIEAQLKAAQARSLEIVGDADQQATKILNEAREETARLRLRAAEEARAAHQEALRKNQEAETEQLERLQRELNEKRKEVLNQLRIESEKERERTAKELAAEKEAAQLQNRTLTERLKNAKAEVERAERDKSQLETEFAALKTDLAAANKLLSEVEDMEKRKAQLDQELAAAEKARTHALAAAEKTKANALAAIEKEANQAKQATLVAYEEKKRELEAELAKRRLAELSHLENQIRTEEKKYEQTKKLRAVEITQKVYEKLIINLEKWMKDPQTAAARMKEEIEAVVTDVTVSGPSTIQAVGGTVDAAPTARQEVRDKKIRKNLAYFGAAALIGIAVFRREVFQFFQDLQKDSYASKILERRRIQSIYNPSQTDDYRDSYTDNVLYKKNYFESKTDDACTSKWALHLNKNLGLLRSMNLAEDNIVQYIGKETSLVKKLGELRSSIDAVYLSEGLERMRKTEDEYVAEMEKVLKGEANYKKIRGLEREFLQENTPNQKCKSEPGS